MKLEGFKKMPIKKQEKIYGGWAWIVAAVPFVLEGLLSLTTTLKVLESNQGSVKTKKADIKWSTSKETETKSSKISKVKEVRRIFYVF